MTPPLILAAIAAAFALSALLARSRRQRTVGMPLSRRTAAGTVTCVTALGIGYLSVVYFAPSWLKTRSTAPRPAHLLPEGRYPEAVLPVDAPTPVLDPQGWINGVPDFKRAKLTLIDVWGEWCPFCRATAPGLVQSYAKFKNRGVAFVSITTMGEKSVQTFVDAHAVPWPAAYGVPTTTIAHFGAYNRGNMLAGYEVAPTFYIVDSEGRVVWCDQQGRYRHEEPEKLLARVEAALEEALGSGEQ